MSWRWTLPFLVAFGLQVACGCVFGKSGDDAPAAKVKGATREAEISIKSQELMLTKLNDTNGASEAWGVFSEGGWSNSGQVMVVLSPDRKVRQLLIMPPNKPDVAVDRALTDAELASLETAFKQATTLADVDITSFDGLVFEIVHATREQGGKATVQKRVLLRNPGNKPTPEHDAVVAAFQKLRRP